MTVYEYTPEKNTKRLTSAVMLLSALAAVCFFFPVILPDMPFKWILQLFGVAALAAVIFIIARYASKDIVYRIVEDGGELDLTVSEVTNGGKSVITVCRISLSGIEESVLLRGKNDETERAELMRRARSEGRRIFNYCPDIKSEPLCFIFAEESGERLLIKISPDEKLMRFLER